jgi:hypothetical protein
MKGMATPVYGYKSKNSFIFDEIPVKSKPAYPFMTASIPKYGYVYPNVKINPTFVKQTLPRVS